MNLREHGPGLSIQTRGAVVGFRAGHLAVVTVHAEALIDEQHVRGFPKALLHKEAEHIAGAIAALHAHVLLGAGAHGLLHLGPKRRRGVEQGVEGVRIEGDRFRFHRGAHGRGAGAVAQ